MKYKRFLDAIKRLTEKVAQAERDGEPALAAERKTRALFLMGRGMGRLWAKDYGTPELLNRGRLWVELWTSRKLLPSFESPIAFSDTVFWFLFPQFDGDLIESRCFWAEALDGLEPMQAHEADPSLIAGFMTGVFDMWLKRGSL